HILRGITRYVRTVHQSLLMARDQRALRPHDALSHLEFSPALQHRADATIIRCVRGEGRQPRACRIEMGTDPSWSKDGNGAARMINARAETVASAPAFRAAFKPRPCLVVADG